MGKFKDLVTEPEEKFIVTDGNKIVINPEYFSLLRIIRGLEMSYYEKQAAGSLTKVSEGSGNILNWQLYFKNENPREV